MSPLALFPFFPHSSCFSLCPPTIGLSTSLSIFSVWSVCPSVHASFPILLFVPLPICPVACLSSCPLLLSCLCVFLSLQCSHQSVHWPLSFSQPLCSACLLSFLYPCPLVCLPACLPWASCLPAALSRAMPTCPLGCRRTPMTLGLVLQMTALALLNLFS